MPSFATLLSTITLLASAANGAPLLKSRQAACTQKVVNFDDAQFNGLNGDVITAIPAGFGGFNWDGFGTTSCPGKACTSFPANTTQTFTAPRLAMSLGLVGGLLNGKFVPKTSPKGTFTIQEGSFDINTFTVFDIIDLPEQVKLGAREDMRVHMECTSADSSKKGAIKQTIKFIRNKDSAGYFVEKLGPDFTNLKSCKVSTTQVFFPLGHELEIPTESMGIDNLDVCVRA